MQSVTVFVNTRAPPTQANTVGIGRVVDLDELPVSTEFFGDYLVSLLIAILRCYLVLPYRDYLVPFL